MEENKQHLRPEGEGAFAYTIDLVFPRPTFYLGRAALIPALLILAEGPPGAMRNGALVCST